MIVFLKRTGLTILLFFGLCDSTLAQDVDQELGIEPTLAIGSIESLTLRRLKENERMWGSGDEVVITNACGKASVTFNIEAATRNIGKQFSTTESIGEWCKPPFEFREDYFLVLENGSIQSWEKVLYTEEDDPVLYIDQDYLDDLKELAGTQLQSITIENFPAVVLYPGYPNPNDSGIVSSVQSDDALEIMRFDDDEYVVVTQGVMLRQIFPDL